ncbi:ABC transporter ATP-binding protein [Ignavigranum ruoffiae]|uniref:ABC transporter ATP-binding protein n=1 Tax=Ignavigranum ruoffiae TaxID=89093 RepID=UPI002066B30B|nr:ABC transporter ATP-binding protein [Ignavigranum ruoffiae]UPQ86234.1 ABC transporter ATP-binding protein [Ignavigranum ruoffiae]
MTPVINIQELSKVYGQKQALTELNLQVQSGDFFAFIGPNGAGKSTTIRILLGLLNKTSGRAQLFGQDVGPQKSQLLQKIAYVPAEVNYYSKFKVNEIFKFAASIRSQLSPELLNNLAQDFDLDLNKRVKDLSLGNRKKIAIVLALAQQADLYILDEPTSGLDPLMQQIFWQKIQEQHRQGATIFVSSHILSEVQKYCQQVAIIRQGRIIAQGPMQDLLINQSKQLMIKGSLDPQDLLGISHLKTEPGMCSFLYQGSMTDLLAYLHRHQDQIVDLTIQQPDLESLFIHYYAEKAGEADGLLERS